MTETAKIPATPCTGDASKAAAVQAGREEELIQRVLDSFARTPDVRLKELMGSLVRHLHAFIRDVRLSEDEWDAAIQFLTAVGHITDDRRQEFVLLSDVLGASMQVIGVNNPADGEATESTVFGPFFVEDAPEIRNGEDISGGAAGQPSWVEGTVRNTRGEAIPDARIEVWEADEDGFYDVQYDDQRVAGRAFLRSDADGAYAFWGLTPTPYPIPHDGPVGQLLEATKRSPVRASHLHFMVTAPGCRRLITHIFVEDDPQLEVGDSVFGVKDSLIRRFAEQQPGTPTPDGRDLGDRTWTRTRFDIILADADA